MTYRYRLVVCAIVKNEMPYLLEWIAYHRIQGVEHFILFDNDSTDGTFETIRSLERVGLATCFRWPNRLRYPGFDDLQIGPQVPAYNFGLRFAQSTEFAKWIAFIDLDEFIVPTKGTFSELLYKYDNFAGLAISWLVFGSSGHRHYAQGLVLERFNRCSQTSFTANTHVKCCVQANSIERANTHVCYPNKGQIVRSNYCEINYDKDGLEGIFLGDDVVINHYFVKSYEEWQTKCRRGRATRALGDAQRFRDDRMFHEYDRNEESDSRVTRFVDATRQEIDRIKWQLCL
jgi:glycosyltransferase involved in cell wall biosynthesis